MRAGGLPDDRSVVKTKYGYHRTGGYRALRPQAERSEPEARKPTRIINRYPGKCVQCGEWVEAESGWAWPGKPRPWTNEFVKARWLVAHAVCMDKLKGKDGYYSPPHRIPLTQKPSED